ncbi:Protein tincar [Halotydeus destructor]|nr:Protein tincar [Halotydeus destructor]
MSSLSLAPSHKQGRSPRHPSGGSVGPPLKERPSSNGSPTNYNGQEAYTLNSLWSIWYGTAAICFQVYIIAKSVQRFTGYLSLPWPNSEPPYRELNAYVILTGIGVVILPFFVVATMMKIGNHANDGRKLGHSGKDKRSAAHQARGQIRRQEEPIRDAVYENFASATAGAGGGRRGAQRSPQAGRGGLRLFRLIWRHSMPTGALLHALAALCFLVPRILMEAQLISYGFLPKANIWKTEMDIVLNHIQDGRVEVLDFLNPINETERRWLEETLEEGPIWRDAILLRKHPVSSKLDIEPGTMSAEFINLVLALIVISVRYPSVFWATNKSFGMVFSLQLFITNVTIMMAYSAFSVLYKVHVYGPERALLRYPSKLSLDIVQSALLAGLYIVSLIASGSVVYSYGYAKYSDWKRKQLMKCHITAPTMGPGRAWGYMPHFMALVSMAFISLSAIPLMYDLVLVYCGSLDSAALCGAAIVAFHLLLWMLLWLSLTIKNTWTFSSPSVSITGQTELDKKPSAKGDTPLLIIDRGQTYQVREVSSKQVIRNLAQRSRASGHHVAQSSVASSDIGSEDVYWLRPKPPTPVGDKSRETEPNEPNSLSWLRKKKQSPLARKKVLEERPGSSKVKRKNSLSSLLGRNKKDNDINEALSDDGDYATLRRQLVNRDETDDNLAAKATLCSVKEEDRMSPSISRTFGPATNGAQMNGDYELLVEQSNVERHFSPLPAEPLYGQRRAFNSPVPSTNVPYSPLKVQTQVSSEQAMEHKRLGSISSESSTQSPEKNNSDTSSGVHSGSPNSSLTSEKRSASAENLAKCFSTTRATWKSSSLQRGYPGHPGAVEVKCPRVNFIAENPYHCEQLPPPMEEDESTMVIRRSKRPQTEISLGQNGTNMTVFSRATNLRMTSFAENSEAETFMRDNSLPFPPQPRSLFESDLRQTESPYATYGAMVMAAKPVMAIPPNQLPPYPASSGPQVLQQQANHGQHIQQPIYQSKYQVQQQLSQQLNQQTYGQIEQRDSANYSVSSSERESEFMVQLQRNFC